MNVIQHDFAYQVMLNDKCDASSDGRGASEICRYLVANYRRLHQRLQFHLGCPDLASESLHNAWLRLANMRIAPTIQSPYSYIYCVACNLVVDELRSRKIGCCIADTEVGLNQIADPSPGPESIAETRSNLQHMQRALKGLPHRHQMILIALCIEERSQAEVAHQHGVSSRHVDTL